MWALGLVWEERGGWRGEDWWTWRLIGTHCSVGMLCLGREPTSPRQGLLEQLIYSID